MEDVVSQIGAGKNDWNNYEVGVKDGAIFIRDESGYIDFSEKEIDSLVDALDQARRKLREIERSPTEG